MMIKNSKSIKNTANMKEWTCKVMLIKLILKMRTELFLIFFG